MIVIGGLFSFFSRIAGEQAKKEKETTSPSPTRRQADWRNIFQSEEFKEVLQQPLAKQDEITTEKTAPIGKIELKQEEKSTKSSVRKAERKEAMKKVAPPLQIQRTGRSHQSLSLHYHQLSNEDLMKGIVWSEVLGPPRAKRRSNYRRSI